MNRLKSIWLVCLALLMIHLSKAQVPFDCSGQYYVTLSILLNSPSDLYEVKFTGNNTVTFENININIGGNINAIGYRSSDNFIYGVDPDEYFLYQLDATGTAYLLGTPSLSPGVGYFGGDVTPDGKYLVLIGGNGRDEVLSLVDLEDPNFGTTNIGLGVVNTRIYDMAFDPILGTLYGFDSNNKRLVTINVQDGTINSAFPVQNNINSIGALFFDTFGNLFAYGGNSNGGNEQSVLFEVNKQTGRLTFAAVGPLATGNDGCSCPYTIKLEKTVFPEITLPCTEVEYTFRVANYSGRSQTGIELVDQLPDGFNVKEILSNPYGGNVNGDPQNLAISNMTVSTGLDSIVVLVEIDELAPGLYYNQAILQNLPSQLGGSTLSDNPKTFVPSDSTVLELIPLSLEFIEEEQYLCEGDTLIIDATLLGAEILWDDGSTDPIHLIQSAGTYVVEATTNCNSIIKTIYVYASYLRLSTDEENIKLNLGESVFLDLDVENTGQSVDFSWNDPLSNSLDCYDCEDAQAFPLFDVIYTVSGISDEGCKDQVVMKLEIFKPRKLFAPNIFSPDGNGLNDIFYLFGNSQTKILSLTIFNRWGEQVFKQKSGFLNDATYGWDGSFHEADAQPSVYIWIAEVEFLDGFRKLMTGDVTLVR